jgi:TonB family protein
VADGSSGPAQTTGTGTLAAAPLTAALTTKDARASQGATTAASTAQQVQPVLSSLMQRLGETEGRVTLRLLISADGRAQKVTVVRPSSYARLDSAVVQAATHSRYQAAMCNGQSVASWWEVTYVLGAEATSEPAGGLPDCRNLPTN